eukprot:6185564-Pleurochrysis_carterae.AAC.3
MYQSERMPELRIPSRRAGTLALIQAAELSSRRDAELTPNRVHRLDVRGGPSPGLPNTVRTTCVTALNHCNSERVISMPTLNSVGGPKVQCQNCSTRCISMKLYCLMLFGLTMTTVSGYRQSAMPFLRRDSHSVRQTYLAWPFKVRNAGPMMTASVQPDSVLQV